MALVRAEPDPWFAFFVLEGLEQHISRSSPYYGTVILMRNEMSKDLLFTLWDPRYQYLRPYVQIPAITDRRLEEQARQRSNVFFKQMEREKEYARFLQRLEEDRLAAVKKHLKEQQRAEQLALEEMIRALAKHDAKAIEQRLRDEQPLNRWLAVQVVARKRLPQEKELIALLDDEQPMVRSAAKQSLVHLSRGIDWGPPANAAGTAITQAQQHWSQWLALQEPPPTAAAPRQP